MENRIIAILNTDGDQSVMDNVLNSVQMLQNCGRLMYFSRGDKIEGAESIALPPECDNETKCRNWMNRYFRGMSFTGFLHVITGTCQILRSPFMFMSDIENMMRQFDYGVWFNTVCDGCNYVYNKYNPRVFIDLDRPDVQVKLGMSTRVNFTSHSNQQWIAYDFANVPDDLLRFEEDFTVPMFWIIEFLARRRNTKPVGSLYFMNYYLTVDSERGVFRNYPKTDHESKNTSRETMQAEDALFKSKNVNFTADSNIDVVLETFWKKVKEKTEKQV